MMTTRYRGAATPARRQRLLERDGPNCWWCHEQFTDELPPTIDHLIPHRGGGSNDDDNLVLACAPCNNHRKRECCEACGHRIRKWGSAVWVDRRHLFHGDCLRRTVLVTPTCHREERQQWQP